MSNYEKHTWASNEMVTAAKLNHIEEGVNDAVTLEAIAHTAEEISSGYDFGKGLILHHIWEPDLTLADNDVTDKQAEYNAATGGNVTSNPIGIVDKNNELITGLFSWVLPGGDTISGLHTYNITSNGGRVTPGIQIRARKDGTVAFGVSHPAEFRDAIHTENLSNKSLNIMVSDVDIATANNGLTTYNDKGTYFWDKNNKMYGGFECIATPRDDKKIYTQLFAQNNASQFNSISVIIDNAGNKTYGVNDPAAFRSAIDAPGLNSANTFSGSNTFTGGFSVLQDIGRKVSTIDATKANNDISTAQYPALAIVDKNGKQLNRFENVTYADGRIGLKINTINYNTSGETVGNSSMTTFVSKTGAVTWELNHPVPFRKATKIATGQIASDTYNGQSSTTKTITWDQQLPDTNYVVVVTRTNAGDSTTWFEQVEYMVTNKTVSQASLFIWNGAGSGTSVKVGFDCIAIAY